MKLGIGGAQFGLDYGISNREGQTAPEEVATILQLAQQHGVELIDTAPAYGSSEEVIGGALALAQPSLFKVVTKTPRFSNVISDMPPADALRSSFHRSLARLRQPHLYGLLFHSAADLIGSHGEELMEAASSLKCSGLVRKIGVSVYNGAEIDAVLSRHAVDLVQVPINVLDQRLIEGGHFTRLKRKGVEIHARSVFLQGLLLMRPEELKPFFAPVLANLTSFRATVERLGLTPAAGALAFIRSIPEIDAIICGINEAAQLSELISAFVGSSNRAEGIRFVDFAAHCEEVLNPSQWKK